MEFKDIIIGKSEKIVEIMQQLRALSLTIHPEIEEDFYGGNTVQMALYSIGRKDNPIHGIAAGKDHCKLFFHHFDKVDVSMFKLEGKGKHSRHIKIFDLEGFDQKTCSKVLKNIAKIAKSKI